MLEENKKEYYALRKDISSLEYDLYVLEITIDENEQYTVLETEIVEFENELDKRDKTVRSYQMLLCKFELQQSRYMKELLALKVEDKTDNIQNQINEIYNKMDKNSKRIEDIRFKLITSIDYQLELSDKLKKLQESLKNIIDKKETWNKEKQIEEIKEQLRIKNDRLKELEPLVKIKTPDMPEGYEPIDISIIPKVQQKNNDANSVNPIDQQTFDQKANTNLPYIETHFADENSTNANPTDEKPSVEENEEEDKNAEINARTDAEDFDVSEVKRGRRIERVRKVNFAWARGFAKFVWEKTGKKLDEFKKKQIAESNVSSINRMEGYDNPPPPSWAIDAMKKEEKKRIKAVKRSESWWAKGFRNKIKPTISKYWRSLRDGYEIPVNDNDENLDALFRVSSDGDELEVSYVK